ncbi:MAG: hypothetical protein Q8O90_08475 [Elusimicrobiota bacterium]|nr:hypothetical protein [Elusimicrobiota bacterium]
MKYWAYVNNEILGPFEKGKLLELPSFSPSLLVCPQTPVGEKTEDWKEASTYPELSALIGQGSMTHAPAAAADVLTVAPETFAPAPAPEPVAKPLESHSLSFKPLTASKSLDPVPPAEHAPAGINIASNRLGKAGGEHTQAAQSQQSSSAFDPISLSRIERRSESLSGQNQPAPDALPHQNPSAAAQPHKDSSGAAPEGIALEPTRAFPQPAEQLPPVVPVQPYKDSSAAAAESSSISFGPAAEPAPAPVMETFSRPAAAAPAPVADIAGLESLVRRLDALSKNSATRQDINSAVDPLRMKLDQMGEVISSIKNSQFQREVMDKLVYLENAVGELKVAFRNPQQAPAPAPVKMEMEKNSDTVFGVQPVKQAEKPKPEPAKEAAKPAEMADTGSKPSRIVPALKKIFRLLITLVLLAAVLVGALFGLKNFMPDIFAKIPAAITSKIPLLGSKPAQPQQTEAEAQKAALAAMEELSKESPPEQQAQQPGEQGPQPAAPGEQEALGKTLQEQSPKKPMQADAAPEIIYITRTLKLKPGGPSLEDKIYEHAGNAGGNFNRTSWEVQPAAEGLFDITAVIPAKTNSLNYTFVVDRAKKSVSPSNDAGKAAFEALVRESEAKPPKRSPKKGSARPAAKPQAKKAAPKKQAAPEEEYEYEYVEDDGTEQ